MGGWVGSLEIAFESEGEVEGREGGPMAVITHSSPS